MNLISNTPSFCDSLTDGWTKKNWALNLIPLGGIASVTYEIGSACFSSRNRTAKISEDFCKEPLQTTIRKITQCLWVPIIIYTALNLVCFIVKVCWNRCFPSANNRAEKESHIIEPLSSDTSLRIPNEVIVYHIFSYLNLCELGISRLVSKRWNELASTEILWQSAIYREIAFTSKNWAQLDSDLVKGVDMRQEMLSLPKNIAEELRRSAFPKKSIRETHVLVRIPKGLTIKKLGILAYNYFSIYNDGYRYICSGLVDEMRLDKPFYDKAIDELEDKPVDESAWLLMTKDVLEESKFKTYWDGKKILANLSKRDGVTYKLPTTLEAMTCVLAEYSRSKNRLFRSEYFRCEGFDQMSYTFCKDTTLDFPTSVGGFFPDTLTVNLVFKYHIFWMGVVAFRKF